jgi:hypothetical protein
VKKIMIISLFLTGAALAQSSPQPIKLKAILEVASSDSGEQLGAYVKGVGDLNHDGYADVAASAPGIFKTFIYYGGKTMSQTPSLTLIGGGHIVAGDFKGNGWIDLAIEKASHDTVLVYYNGPSGLDTIPDLILTLTPPSDYFGYVMTVGDFFRNGYANLAVGTLDDYSPNTELELRGRIFIYAGGPNGVSETPVDTIVGDTVRAGLGEDLAAGDLYGDGRDEIVALGYSELGSTPQTQYYYVSVFEADSSLHMRGICYIDARHVPGGFGGVGGGGSVACFDADGDGIADILVSGICIFKGGTKIDTMPTYHVGPPNSDTTDFGAFPWVGGGGDNNGDGIPDILLASERGRYGSTSGVFVMVDGRGHPGQYMGYRVFSDYLAGDVNLAGNPENAGDVNGGGVDDIIIGNGGYPYPAYNGFFGIYSGDTSMVASVKELHAAPAKFNLDQNFPNPFNPSTSITYQLSAVSKITLKIYDILGREVKTLADEEETAGQHAVLWDGTDQHGRRVASGVYYYRLTSAAGGSVTKKAVLIK